MPKSQGEHKTLLKCQKVMQMWPKFVVQTRHDWLKASINDELLVCPVPGNGNWAWPNLQSFGVHSSWEGSRQRNLQKMEFLGNFFFVG